MRESNLFEFNFVENKLNVVIVEKDVVFNFVLDTIEDIIQVAGKINAVNKENIQYLYIHVIDPLPLVSFLYHRVVFAFYRAIFLHL